MEKMKHKQRDTSNPRNNKSKSPTNNNLNKLHLNSSNSPNKKEGQNVKKSKVTKIDTSTIIKNKAQLNKSIKESNPIPNKAKERLSFLRNIYNNESLQRHYNNSPPRLSSNIEDTASYLSTFSKNDFEISALIYLWITNNISFDTNSFFSGNLADQTPENVFKTGIGVSIGYADLFTKLCKIAGIKAETVPGYVKGYNYREQQPMIKINHHWNVINLHKTWYIVDSCWGSGFISDEKKFERKFTYYYFLSMPELIIGTHRPKEDKWQLSTKTISHKQYEEKKSFNYSSFYTAVYEKNIELYSHSHPVILFSHPDFQLKMGLRNHNPIAKLFLDNVELEDKISTEYDANNNMLKVETKFEKNGEYTLNIMNKVNKEGKDILLGVLSYTIIVNILITHKRTGLSLSSVRHSYSNSPLKSLLSSRGRNKKDDLNNTADNINPDSLISPFKPKCFDNINAHLYEPKNHNIKIGQTVKFKVKVKGATSVAILDYKQFSHLKKKGDDIWEGTIVIKSVHVSIVSQKSSSLFTEIFEFSNVKP